MIWMYLTENLPKIARKQLCCTKFTADALCVYIGFTRGFPEKSPYGWRGKWSSPLLLCKRRNCMWYTCDSHCGDFTWLWNWLWAGLQLELEACGDAVADLRATTFFPNKKDIQCHQHSTSVDKFAFDKNIPSPVKCPGKMYQEKEDELNDNRQNITK